MTMEVTMKLRKMLIATGIATTIGSVLACSNSGSSGLGSTPSGLVPSGSTPLSSFPAVSSNLRISLTDAPSRNLKSVFVNVDHAELFVNKGGSQGRLIVAQNLGLVDLMTLRNGVLLPMQDLTIPAGTEITQIRLVLKADDNHGVKSDDSRCEMQTPSGQQSGIKIHLSQPFTIDSNYTYSMVMDFDAEKSVVVKGNGGCLLKPVLKLMTVTKVAVPAPDDGSGGTGNEPGDDNGTDPSTDPGTVTDPSTGGDIITVTDGTDTNVGGGDGGATDPNTVPNDGGGFEIPTDPVDPTPVITTTDLVNL
jgi:hypothetical protein